MILRDATAADAGALESFDLGEQPSAWLDEVAEIVAGLVGWQHDEDRSDLDRRVIVAEVDGELAQPRSLMGSRLDSVVVQIRKWLRYISPSTTPEGSDRTPCRARTVDIPLVVGTEISVSGPGANNNEVAETVSAGCHVIITYIGPQRPSPTVAGGVEATSQLGTDAGQ